MNKNLPVPGWVYDNARVCLTTSLYKYGHKLRYKRYNDPHNYDIYLVDGYIKICSKKGKEYECLTWDEFMFCWLEMRDEYNGGR